MLKKTCRTQILENFEYFSNLLIINNLRLNLLFLSSNATQNPPTFQFLFRRAFKTTNYTFLNISSENHRFLPPKQEFFNFQRAVFKFSAHSERISSALWLKLQCAENLTRVRWKFENLVLFSKRLFAEDK